MGALIEKDFPKNIICKNSTDYLYDSTLYKHLKNRKVNRITTESQKWYNNDNKRSDESKRGVSVSSMEECWWYWLLPHTLCPQNCLESRPRTEETSSLEYVWCCLSACSTIKYSLKPYQHVVCSDNKINRVNKLITDYKRSRIRHKGTVGPARGSLWQRPPGRSVSSPAAGRPGSICVWKGSLVCRLGGRSCLLHLLLLSSPAGKKELVWHFPVSLNHLFLNADHRFKKQRQEHFHENKNRSWNTHLFWVSSGSVSLRVGSERNRSSPEELIIAETLERIRGGDGEIK